MTNNSRESLQGDSSELNEANRTASSLTELSELELDHISGGISFFLSGSIFDQQVSFSRQGRRRREKVQGASKTFSSAFQFGGSGFSSIEDVMSVLSGLLSLFGRKP